MGSIDVTIYYDQYRIAAMERILSSQNRKLDDEIQKQMDALYESIVPEQERSDIEERIRQEEIQRAAEYEASRRFALVHLHDANEDYYLVTEKHTDFFQSARLFRAVMKDIAKLWGKGGKSPLSDLNQMRIAYMEHEPLTEEAFTKRMESAPNDHRIKAMIEFDFENGTISVCEGSDNHWSTYMIKDVSAAAFYADLKMGVPYEDRREIFDSRLEGKEINCDQEETLVADIQMQ